MQLYLQSKKSFLSLILMGLMTLSSLLYSCKTEYIDFPYKDIESFAIQDANGKTLQASIVDDRIVVYWPPMQDIPTSITPTITLSERATISPSSGTPIAVNETTPAQYTVIAQDGSSKTYTVEFNINQPTIQAKLNLGGGNYIINSNEGIIRLMTEHILEGEGQTSVFLIDASGTETPLQITNIVPPASINVLIPSTTTLGTYTIKVISGLRMVTTLSFEITAPPPIALVYVIATTAMERINVKRGDKFTLTYDNNPNVPDPVFEQHYQDKIAYFLLTDRARATHRVNPVYDRANKKVELTLPANTGPGALRAIQAIGHDDLPIGGSITVASFINVVE